MKKNNKGFTLVELIVVLVILAILAAILVPALLGYIDRAREKQYVLNAKSALTATQAELSSLYGENKALDENLNSLVARKDIVASTADTPNAAGTGDDASHFWVALGGDSSKGAVSDNHERYTIRNAYYGEGTDNYCVFDGSTWTSSKAAPSAPTGMKWVQVY